MHTYINFIAVQISKLFFPSFSFKSKVLNNSARKWHKIFKHFELKRDIRSRPEEFLRKGVLKICSQFTGEHPCRSPISKKLQSNFIEITLRHGCSPVNLLHVFRTPFLKNISGRLPLKESFERNGLMSKAENHCVKSVRIRSYSGPCFPAFGLSTERYGVSLHI